MSGFSGGGASSSSVHPGYIAGNWYAPPLGGAVAAGSVLANGSVRLMPFYLTKSIKISDLGCRITTGAASGNVRLAIYRGDVSLGRPTTPIVETGNIGTGSTGPFSAAVASQQTLAPGLYFMAVNADNATVVLQIISNGSSNPTAIVGSATLANVTGGSTAANMVYSFASAFGAFPDLTGQTLTETAPSSGSGLVFMKAV